MKRVHRENLCRGDPIGRPSFKHPVLWKGASHRLARTLRTVTRWRIVARRTCTYFCVLELNNRWRGLLSALSAVTIAPQHPYEARQMSHPAWRIITDIDRARDSLLKRHSLRDIQAPATARWRAVKRYLASDSRPTPPSAASSPVCARTATLPCATGIAGWTTATTRSCKSRPSSCNRRWQPRRATCAPPCKSPRSASAAFISANPCTAGYTAARLARWGSWLRQSTRSASMCRAALRPCPRRC